MARKDVAIIGPPPRPPATGAGRREIGVTSAERARGGAQASRRPSGARREYSDRSVALLLCDLEPNMVECQQFHAYFQSFVLWMQCNWWTIRNECTYTIIAPGVDERKLAVNIDVTDDATKMRLAQN
jgi:hypothetical protein